MGPQIFIQRFAQNNALGQDGNGDAEQLIGQSQLTGQAAECLSDANTVASCNNVGLSLNCNGDECGSSNPGQRATLTVIKQVDCESSGGEPTDTAVCDAVFAIAQPSKFPMRIEANNPDPAEFVGSATGPEITLDAGLYRIFEDTSAVQDQVEQALDTDDVSFNIDASGDCDNNDEVADARGTIGPGEEQTCIITNTVVVVGGTVPPTG